MSDYSYILLESQVQGQNKCLSDFKKFMMDNFIFLMNMFIMLKPCMRGENMALIIRVMHLIYFNQEQTNRQQLENVM